MRQTRKETTMWPQEHSKKPHQKLERGKEGFHPEFQRKHDPLDRLILDF